MNPDFHVAPWRSILKIVTSQHFLKERLHASGKYNLISTKIRHTDASVCTRTPSLFRTPMSFRSRDLLWSGRVSLRTHPGPRSFPSRGTRPCTESGPSPCCPESILFSATGLETFPTELAREAESTIKKKSNLKVRNWTVYWYLACPRCGQAYKHGNAFSFLWKQVLA